MDINLLAIVIGFFIYVIYYVTVGVKHEQFDEFPYDFKTLNIKEDPILVFSEYFYIGKSYFSLRKFPLTKIYLYNNFMVANYRGHTQIYNYDKSKMEIKKDFRGQRITILTNGEEAFFFINKKQAAILTRLINNCQNIKN